MRSKQTNKTLISIILLFMLITNASAFRIGAKYGYVYTDDYDDGKTYSALLNIPISANADIELEYGKYEDDDGNVDGKYGGLFFGLNLGDYPFKLKVGYIKNEFDIKQITDGEYLKEDFDENEFSYGISTGLRLPYFSGYVEYLVISDDIYTIAARVLF